MRKLVIVASILGAWWLWRDEPAARSTARVQAAVLPDGFAVLQGPTIGVHGRDGAPRGQATLRLDHADVRLVGTRGGPAVGFRDGRKLALGMIRKDGRVEIDSSWGANVQLVCDGAATNQHRFGVGWVEPDGRVWFVHGPVDAVAAAQVAPLTATAAGRTTWCAIASAEQDVALLWRERSTVQLQLCDRRQCAGVPTRMPITARDTVLGFGCAERTCVIAARDTGGAVRLHRVSDRGRKAVQVLEGAAAGTPVTIVGAGPRAVAIAYLASAGHVAIQRLSVDGALSDLGTLDAGPVPSLAWADGRLLVAPAAGAPIVLALPR